MTHFYLGFVITLLGTGFVRCGKNDNLIQLEVAYGNLDLNSVYEQAEVPKVLYGGTVGVPADLEGSFVRHGCGVFGHVLDYEIPDGSNGVLLDRIEHLFDCIPVVQAFHFHEGRATFTSKFYDTTRNDIYRDTYNQEMRDSSVFFETIFSKYNPDKVAEHRPNFTQPKLGEVPHVSWWTIGNDVLAMGEYPRPLQVDPHNGRHMNATYELENLLPEGIKMFNPAHQAYDETLGLISTTGMIDFDPNNMSVKTKRIVYAIDGDIKRPNVTTEIPYSDAAVELSSCDTTDGFPKEKRIRYTHSVAATENYIIIPETSYILDYCKVFNQNHDPMTPFFSQVDYDNTIKGRFIVIAKNDTSNPKIFEANHHFFITHLFNAFELEGKIYVDALKYENADVYEEHTKVAKALYSDERPQNKIMRYSMEFYADELKVEDQELFKQPEKTFVEFSNINPNYYGKPYRYGYAVRNVFGLQNAIVKFDFADGTEEPYELPDGEFGTEPIFVPAKNASDTEDAGWVLVQTIDSTTEKANILILRAENMAPEFKAQAPELGLHGIHSGFFPFDVGCTLDNCVPEKSGANILERSTLTFLLFAFTAVFFM